MQFRLCNMIETDCSTYLTRVCAGSPMTQFEQTEAWLRQRDQLRQVVHNLGSRVQYEESHGSSQARLRSRVRRPCTGRRRSSSQVQVTYISLQIRSSVPTYLLISHTEYDTATAFGHTGMFRGTAPVGGPYPGMVPGPQIPVYTG